MDSGMSRNTGSSLLDAHAQTPYLTTLFHNVEPTQGIGLVSYLVEGKPGFGWVRARGQSRVRVTR